MNVKIVDTAGQLTAIITNSSQSKDKRIETANNLLKSYPNMGQVAYLNTKNKIAKLSMAGDELSLNGTLAVFASLGKLGKNRLFVEALQTTIKAQVSNTQITALFPLSIVSKESEAEVQFDGIAYRLAPLEKKSSYVSMINEIAANSTSPAVGIIFYENKLIKPLVLVKSLGTLNWETACGSASLVYFLKKGVQEVKQPSGKTIRIDKIASGYRITLPYTILLN